MRLFEVEDRFVNDLVMVLRELRGRSDTEHSSLTLPWAAVNNILKNLGYGELNTAALASLVKQSPALNAEVETFDDETGITLATQDQEEEEPTKVPTGPSVDQMAHKAAKKYQADLK